MRDLASSGAVEVSALAQRVQRQMILGCGRGSNTQPFA